VSADKAGIAELAGHEHPITNGRFTNVAELVRVWAEEREQPFSASR